MTFSGNHYELLEVSQKADDVALRRAFCKLSKALHPDTTLLPKKEAADKFQKICEAYEILADPVLRKNYDSSLELIEVSQKQSIPFEESLINSWIPEKKNLIGVRRPLSGGELFSLLLLGITLLISLLLGIGFAMSQGRELMTTPSWLMTFLLRISN